MSESEKRKILVVEDQPGAALLLRKVLERLGHEVRIASDGGEALDSVRRFRPQIVLCDIGLPDMDGYEVARAMRSDPEASKAYLVALTGYAGDEDRRRAVEAGFDYHVSKSLDVGELERIVSGQPRS